MLKQLIFVFLCSIHSTNAMDQEIKTDYEKIDEMPAFGSKFDLKNYYAISYSILSNSNIPQNLKEKVLTYLEKRAGQRVVIKELLDHSYMTTLFFFDEDTIITGFEDGSIEVWDVFNNKLIQKLQGHNKPITSFLKVDNDLVSFSRDEGSVKGWKIKSGICIKEIKIKKNHIIHNVSFDEITKTIKIDTIDFSIENPKLSDIKFSEPKFSHFSCCTIL